MDFNSYRLYEPGAGPTKRFVKLVTRGEGERMVRSKTAQEGLDWDGVTPCFRLIGSGAAGAVPTTPQSAMGLAGLETPATAFSMAEMNAIAGTKFKHGRSRTARMSEAQRQARVQQIYDDGIVRNGATIRGIKANAEDMVERATNKFRGFQQMSALMDRVRVVASI